MQSFLQTEFISSIFFAIYDVKVGENSAFELPFWSSELDKEIKKFTLKLTA